MRIGLYQFDVVRDAREENLRRIETGTHNLDVDLLVLPELCTAGYLLTKEEAHRNAIELPGDGIGPLVRIAERLDAWLVAGVIERQGSTLYNTTVLVGPQGWVGSQRKVHLTLLEGSIFTSGHQFQSCVLGTVRVGVVTCFDAWFPEASRQLVRSGTQLLCQPAAFGGQRTLDVMRVRSMENHVFSITANRLGEERLGDVQASFCGKSQIVDCDGEVIACAEQEPSAVCVEVDIRQAETKANVMCADLADEWNRYYRI